MLTKMAKREIIDNNLYRYLNLPILPKMEKAGCH